MSRKILYAYSFLTTTSPSISRYNLVFCSISQESHFLAQTSILLSLNPFFIPNWKTGLSELFIQNCLSEGPVDAIEPR